VEDVADWIRLGRAHEDQRGLVVDGVPDPRPWIGIEHDPGRDVACVASQTTATCAISAIGAQPTVKGASQRGTDGLLQEDATATLWIPGFHLKAARTPTPSSRRCPARSGPIPAPLDTADRRQDRIVRPASDERPSRTPPIRAPTMNRLILAVTLLAFAPTATAQVSPAASHERGRRLGLSPSRRRLPRLQDAGRSNTIDSSRGPEAGGPQRMENRKCSCE
jgi:hypothetical protein